MNTLAKRLATLGCALCAVATLARPSSSSAQFVPQNPGVNGTSTQTQDADVFFGARLRSMLASRYSSVQRRPILSSSQRSALRNNLMSLGGGSTVVGPQGGGSSTSTPIPNQPIVGTTANFGTLRGIGTLTIAPPPPPISRYRP
jgi:hypothetical protein